MPTPDAAAAEPLVAPITPCFWFDTNADEAVNFYVGLFPGSKRLSEARYGPDGQLEQGTTMVVQFELGGRPFMAINGGPVFAFTPAVSFVVNCTSQAQLDHYWSALLEGGTAMQCGWLTDRFGVSWQIVPRRMFELMSDPDPERVNRVMQAMMKMDKIDVAELEAAAGAA